MVAIILAAGYATRLYPLTLHMPKALLKIGGRTMLDHIIDKIDEIPEITKIAVVSNAKFYSYFTEWKSERGPDGGLSGAGAASARELVILDDGTVSEETRRGAIGDIKFAIDVLDLREDAMIIAGDNYFTFRLKATATTSAPARPTTRSTRKANPSGILLILQTTLNKTDKNEDGIIIPPGMYYAEVSAKCRIIS